MSMLGFVKSLAVIGLTEISNEIEDKTGVYKGDKQFKDIIPIAKLYVNSEMLSSIAFVLK